MAVPSAPEARLFYRSANQRLEDGLFLLEGDRTTAAIYLAGYAVECILKALILASVPNRARTALLASFRGVKAHDFDWLREQYLAYGGPPFPLPIARQFTLVNTWRTNLRYNPGTAKRREAIVFLRAAKRILEWLMGGCDMPRRTRNGPPDQDMQSILDTLAAYDQAHPRADIEVYRLSPNSIRIRIIDPDFKGMDRVDRDEAIWKFLEQAPPDAQSQITFLLLLKPGETKRSFGNMEFENPIPLDL